MTRHTNGPPPISWKKANLRKNIENPPKPRKNQRGGPEAPISLAGFYVNKTSQCSFCQCGWLPRARDNLAEMILR